MREAAYQAKVVTRLRDMFPGCEVMENDPALRHQGIPDLLVLWRGVWWMLEVKTSANAPHQPNQDYWVEYYNDMSFASFIYPENEEQVLSDLQHTFGARRKTRLSQSEQLSLAELRRDQVGSKVRSRNGGTAGNRSSQARTRSDSSRRKAG